MRFYRQKQNDSNCIKAIFSFQEGKKKFLVVLESSLRHFIPIQQSERQKKYNKVGLKARCGLNFSLFEQKYQMKILVTKIEIATVTKLLL